MRQAFVWSTNACPDSRCFCACDLNDSEYSFKKKFNISFENPCFRNILQRVHYPSERVLQEPEWKGPSLALSLQTLTLHPLETLYLYYYTVCPCPRRGGRSRQPGGAGGARHRAGQRQQLARAAAGEDTHIHVLNTRVMPMDKSSFESNKIF